MPEQDREILQTRRLELKAIVFDDSRRSHPDFTSLSQEYLLLDAYLNMHEGRRLELAALTRDLDKGVLGEIAVGLHLPKFIRSGERMVLIPNDNSTHIYYSVAVFGLRMPDDAGYIALDRPRARIVIYDGSSSLLISKYNPNRPATVTLVQAVAQHANLPFTVVKEM